MLYIAYPKPGFRPETSRRSVFRLGRTFLLKTFDFFSGRKPNQKPGSEQERGNKICTKPGRYNDFVSQRRRLST